MDVPGFIQSIQASAPAEWMRTSVKAMPIVEAIHVLAAATVFGTVFVVDLRLHELRHAEYFFPIISLKSFGISDKTRASPASTQPLPRDQKIGFPFAWCLSR